MLRLITYLFLLIRRHEPVEWLVVFGLVLWAWVGDTPFMWVLAGLIALLSLAGKATGHAIFWPASHPTAPVARVEQLPPTAFGLATGHVRAIFRGSFEIEMDATVINLPVQVRWLSEVAPPHLAVLAPRNLQSTLKNPTVDASTWSLWYPGSRVRTGWIYSGGQRLFGLELSFVGKRLLLALEDEESAYRFAQQLTSA
ncbi:MAG: hypothetical protein ACOY93_15755 [Bacillota bacterium]